MMNCYETLLSVDSGLIQLLVSKGYMRSTTSRDIEAFEYYTKERTTTGYLQARTNTAEKFCTSDETIARIIQRMK